MLIKICNILITFLPSTLRCHFSTSESTYILVHHPQFWGFERMLESIFGHPQVMIGGIPTLEKILIFFVIFNKFVSIQK